MLFLPRYTIHLWDLNHEGVWENRAIYVYYTELVFELASLSIDFCHHLHMLVRTDACVLMLKVVLYTVLSYHDVVDTNVSRLIHISHLIDINLVVCSDVTFPENDENLCVDFLPRPNSGLVK